MNHAQTVSAPPRSLLHRILTAGTIVAILDGAYVVIVFAVLLKSTTAERIFQGIASRLLGQGALQGGLATAGVGLAMHFGVAYTWTAIYALATNRLAFLRRLATGGAGRLLMILGLGTAIWLVMNRIVVPLTGGHSMPILSRTFLLVWIAHLTVVAPPIVLIAGER
ncbi:MAG: hypothetical protein AB7I33_00635 [Gemmatimonadales bacterium]